MSGNFEYVMYSCCQCIFGPKSKNSGKLCFFLYAKQIPFHLHNIVYDLKRRHIHTHTHTLLVKKSPDFHKIPRFFTKSLDSLDFVKNLGIT